MQFEIGDIVEFKWFGTLKYGEIADFSEDNDIFLIRIPSGEVFKVRFTDIQGLC